MADDTVNLERIYITLDHAFAPIADDANGIEKALELLDDIATLSPGGKQP
jgi:hypothetical protein